MGALFCGFVWILAALRAEDLGLLSWVIYMRYF